MLGYGFVYAFEDRRTKVFRGITRTGTMTISESDRRDLFNNLEVTLGGSAADTLMQLLPYQPADQLVTRVDMHAQTALLHGEMAELRADLTSEMAELRSDLTGEMAQLRTDVLGDMTQLRSDVLGDMAELRSDVVGHMADLRADLTGDMAELRSDLTGEMAQLRTDLTGDMAQLRSDVVGEVADLKVWVQRWVSGAAAVNLVALITALAT